MNRMKRKPQNKFRAAKQFKRNVRKTKAANLIPHRGGFRL